VYIPADSVHDWRRLLAQPHHWKAGYSAMAIARCWQEADGFPASIADLFDNSGIADLASPELLLALPEHKVPLPPARGRPSQSDVFALARSGTRLVAIAVEGKAEVVTDSRKGGAADLPLRSTGDPRVQLSRHRR
jgi:hypothetical protein